MSKFKKTIAGVIGFTVALSLVAVASSAPAKAATVEELLAQITALTAQLNALKGTSTVSVTFTRNLTVGSTGADVTALQNWLASKGYFSGTATGYFGPITKAALAAYQAAKGISPAAGYFGPITRAAVAAEGSTTTGGTTTGGTTTSGTGITTVGKEGTLTVTSSNAGLASTVHEGDSMIGILGAKVEAKDSDIAVQRVKLNLGTSTRIHNKLYKKFYVTDGSNVLASVDSSAVVKDGSTYYLTITGFNFLVKAGETKYLVIKADAYGTIDSTDVTTLNTSTNSQVSFANDGVRGVDGVGIDQYSPATGFGRTVTVSADLLDSATLAVSTNTGTPQAADVIAASGSSENEYDKLPILAIDLKAEKDSVKITDINIGVTKSGTGAATASTTVYLYEGSTEIDSAAVDTSSYNTAVFSDIDYVVPKDTTKTLWVKVDVRNANGTVSQIAATASSTGITAENSRGDSLSASYKTGSATGETFYVRNVGPVFTLVSKSITKSATASQSNTSTSTAEAVFTLKIKAVGGAIDFGTVASSSSAFGTTTSFFKVYQNGAALAAGSFLVASSSAYDTPSTGVTTSGLTETFRLEENNEITLPVTFRFEGRTTAGALVSGGSYSVGLEGIRWGTASTAASVATTFMANDTDWRTSTVSLP